MGERERKENISKTKLRKKRENTSEDKERKGKRGEKTLVKIEREEKKQVKINFVKET